MLTDSVDQVLDRVEWGRLASVLYFLGPSWKPSKLRAGIIWRLIHSRVVQLILAVSWGLEFLSTWASAYGL